MVGQMNRQQRRQAAKAAKRQGGAATFSQDPQMTAAREAHKAGRYAEAEAIYNKLLTENPKNADALHFKGLLFYQHGHSDAAVSVLRQAIKVRPGVASFHGNLANVLLFIGDLEAAEHEFRKAIRLDKNYAMAYANYSALLVGNESFAKAEKAVRRALELQPDNAEAFNNLATILRRQGRLADAEAAFRQAITLNPSYEEAYGNLIFLRDFDMSLSFEEQQRDRRDWAMKFIDPLIEHTKPHDNDKDPERRLRIGYVSGDFRNHSAAITFGAAILERDASSFETYCYMTSALRDPITEKFEASADAWLGCWGMTDADLFDRIRADKIDILVDLAGHSAGNRLPVFARKPAPVQITAWGHCTGTGMAAMDYIFADPIIMPAEDAQHCAEEVIELSCGLNFAPPGTPPDVRETPALKNGYITFGCFNRIEKLVDETLAVWAQVLNQIPTARLALKNTAFESKEVSARMRERLQGQGIDIARVDLIGKSTWREHMDAFGKIDIALDPFPNNGGVTTLETLWMGVPVVAMRGATAPSRVSASILAACNHNDWVGDTIEDYIRIAASRAADPQALQHTRNGLRNELATRPVGNPELYAREVESQYRRVWREWCAQS